MHAAASGNTQSDETLALNIIEEFYKLKNVGE